MKYQLQISFHSYLPASQISGHTKTKIITISAVSGKLLKITTQHTVNGLQIIIYIINAEGLIISMIID